MERLTKVDNIPINTGTIFDDFKPDGSICEAKESYQTGNEFIDRLIKNWIKLNRLRPDPEEAPAYEEMSDKKIYHFNFLPSRIGQYELVLQLNNEGTHIESIYFTNERSEVVKIESSENGSLRFLAFRRDSSSGHLALNSGFIVYPGDQPSLLLQSTYVKISESEEKERKFETFIVHPSCNELCATKVASMFKLNSESVQVDILDQLLHFNQELVGKLEGFNFERTSLYPSASWVPATLEPFSLEDLRIKFASLHQAIDLEAFGWMWIERQDDNGNTVFCVPNSPWYYFITVDHMGNVVSVTNKTKVDCHTHTSFAYIPERNETVKIETTIHVDDFTSPIYTVTITPLSGTATTQKFEFFGSGTTVKATLIQESRLDS